MPLSLAAALVRCCRCRPAADPACRRPSAVPFCWPLLRNRRSLLPFATPPLHQLREERYNEIRDEMRHMLARVGWKPDFIEKSVPILPISGWMGDNLIKKSDKMTWWKGMDVKTLDNRTVHIDCLLDVSGRAAAADAAAVGWDAVPHNRAAAADDDDWGVCDPCHQHAPMRFTAHRLHAPPPFPLPSCRP